MILPRDDAADLDEVPAEVRDDLEVIFAEDMQEVLAAALEPKVDAVPVSRREALRSRSGPSLARSRENPIEAGSIRVDRSLHGPAGRQRFACFVRHRPHALLSLDLPRDDAGGGR